MGYRAVQQLSRRDLLKAAGTSVAGLGLASIPGLTGGCSSRVQTDQDEYFPPSEQDGGWRVGDPTTLGVDARLLSEAIGYHDQNHVTTSYGGALVVIHKGHVIGESYTTGEEGGPQPWTASSCNDMKSSTKSVFGTASGYSWQLGRTLLTACWSTFQTA